MMTLEETMLALLIIDQYPETIAWADFSDRGNSCTGRLDVLNTTSEIAKNAISYAQVKTIMVKYSTLYRTLSKSVAKEMGLKFVSYDWLVKALSRLLEDTTLVQLCQMINLSIFVKTRMKEKGLTQIRSLNEVIC